MASLEIGLNLKYLLTITIFIEKEVKGINQTGINQTWIDQTGFNDTWIDKTGFNDTGK